MSDLMFYAVLRMPRHMAMHDELSRMQFHSRAQHAADRVERAEAALQAIIARADNNEPGTSKVQDMKRIAVEALAMAPPPSPAA